MGLLAVSSTPHNRASGSSIAEIGWAGGKLAGIIIALVVLGVIALMVVGAFVSR